MAKMKQHVYIVLEFNKGGTDTFPGVTHIHGVYATKDMATAHGISLIADKVSPHNVSILKKPVRGSKVYTAEFGNFVKTFVELP